MLQSMTGFAKKEGNLLLESGVSVPITVTIKSVNGRFFEINTRIPHALSMLEQVLAQQLKERLYRGTVSLSIYIQHAETFGGSIQASYPLIESYIQHAKKIQEQFQIAGQITLSDILFLPHVFDVATAKVDQTIVQQVLTLINNAIESLVEMRVHEGTFLKNDLLERLTKIEEIVTLVAPRAEIITKQRTEQLLATIKETLQDTQDEVRNLHIKMAYQSVDKIETHEEIVRLKTHISTFRDTLSRNESLIGKKLDFITQELFREANTLSAKLADAASVTSLIELKTELERMREQVQNIV